MKSVNEVLPNDAINGVRRLILRLFDEDRIERRNETPSYSRPTDPSPSCLGNGSQREHQFPQIGFSEGRGRYGN